MHTLDPPDHQVTPEEYLAFERGSLHNRHEYRNGRIFRHWGGNIWHASIMTDLIAIVGNQLKAEDFEAFALNMRIKVEATSLYTYPDLLITPRDPKCEDQEHDTLLNPLVIVEVLSKKTETYDRGEKFVHYRELPSLQEYLLVSQDKPLVERYTRDFADKWILDNAVGLEAQLTLHTAPVTLKLAEIYARVEFPPEPSPPFEASKPQ